MALIPIIDPHSKLKIEDLPVPRRRELNALIQLLKDLGEGMVSKAPVAPEVRATILDGVYTANLYAADDSDTGNIWFDLYEWVRHPEKYERVE